MTRIEELEQKILTLARQQNQRAQGIFGNWARTLLILWAGQEEWKEFLYEHDWKDFVEENRATSKLELLERLSEKTNEPLLNSLVDGWKLTLELEQKLQELQTERETTQQALQTSQEWHERQKAEIIAEWKQKLTNLLNARKTQIAQELTLIKEVLNE